MFKLEAAYENLIVGYSIITEKIKGNTTRIKVPSSVYFVVKYSKPFKIKQVNP
jgi:hypothetical protein